MHNITLVKKARKGGEVALFFRYSPAVILEDGKKIEYEDLKVTIFANPSDENQALFNRKVEQHVEKYRMKRILQIIENRFEISEADRLGKDFLEFYRKQAMGMSSKAYVSYKHLERFVKGRCRFCDIDLEFCERYKVFLLKSINPRSGKPLSHNTASSYYSTFLSVVKAAYKMRYLREDFSRSLSQIQWDRSRKREFLSEDEIEMLASADFKHKDIQRAALLSCETGLRRSDIIDLMGKYIVQRGESWYIDKVMVKTGQQVCVPLTDRARSLIGNVSADRHVFPDVSIKRLNCHLPNLIKASGITKHITFHSFRHTYAQRLTFKGVDVRAISAVMGHKTIGTTMTYAGIPNEIACAIIKKLT